MKKILIISRLYAPTNKIGAIRPTKFAKYLIEKGYFVGVLTEKTDYTDYKEIEIPGSEFYYISTNFKKINNTYYKSKKNRISKVIPQVIKKMIFTLKHFISELYYYKSFCKMKIDFSQYDVIISTFSTYANNLIAMKVIKQNRNVKWISDFRDSPLQEDTLLGFKTINKRYINKICKKADNITLVSEGLYKSKSFNKYGNKITIIQNGYDLSDLPCIERLQNEKIVFIYAGQLYDGKRDFTIFFRMLSEIINEGKKTINDFEFEYYGSDFNLLFNSAKKYSMEYILKNNGFVTREKVINAQINANFLLLSSWNTKKEQGILTGKLLEYMMIKKPILAFVNGDTPNSEIRKIISESGLGYTYESSQHENDYETMKEYITKNFNVSEEYYSFLDQKYIDEFDYKKITDRLINLIESSKDEKQ